MLGSQNATSREQMPLSLLFLISDTGGGHRNAARAVAQALDRMYPGRFAPVLYDPLSGPGSAWLLRWITGLYGPAIRRAPWLWGAAYRISDSGPAVALLRRTLLRLADRPVADAAGVSRPAAIVSFHPLTGMAADAARDRHTPGTPVVTVVTDLARTHVAWRYAHADLTIAPPAAVQARSRPRRGDRLRSRRMGGDPRRGARGGGGDTGARAQGGGRDAGPRAPAGGGVASWVAAGPPVTREFWGGPLQPGERAILRRSLGLSEDEFLVVLTGGGEGSGGMARRANAILRWFADVHVVAVCGRNSRLKRRLDRRAARSGGRLTVTGFTEHMADLLRCCDLVVTKAGPGTIAEAACCGAPMLLTSHVPGQETGNSEVVTRAAAGRGLPGVRQLVAEIGRLRDDRAAVDAMRAASARMSRPEAAADIARLIASLAQPAAPAGPGVGDAPARGASDAATDAPAGGASDAATDAATDAASDAATDASSGASSGAVAGSVTDARRRARS